VAQVESYLEDGPKMPHDSIESPHIKTLADDLPVSAIW